MTQWIDGPVVLDTGAVSAEDPRVKTLLEWVGERLLGTISAGDDNRNAYPDCPGPLVQNVYRRQMAQKRKEHWKNPELHRADKCKEHGVAFLARMCLESPEKVTVVAMGSLTNLALALRIVPAAAENIREVLLLHAEAAAMTVGVPSDPEAAQIVLDQGIPVSIVPEKTDWHMLPGQADRLARPGVVCRVCLSGESCPGTLIPMAENGNVRVFLGDDRKEVSTWVY